MGFETCEIAAFDTTVSGLPDIPNMEAEALKAVFDASPEQLREAHNALCEAAEARTGTLEGKVAGIVAQTFGGAISEDMLDAPLTEKVNAQPDLSPFATTDSPAFTGTPTAPTAEGTEGGQLANVDFVVSRIATGSYEPGTYEAVTLPFAPRLVICQSTYNPGGSPTMPCLVVPGMPYYGPTNTKPPTLSGNVLTAPSYGSNTLFNYYAPVYYAAFA